MIRAVPPLGVKTVSCPSRHRIDDRPSHGSQVEHQAVVGHGMADDSVAAAAHAHVEVVLADEPEC